MLLKQHFENIEELLIASSRISSISGHSVNKGMPREKFISNFLQSHLSSNISIGTGEIINASSFVGEKRRQIDIVLYRNDYPILNIGDGLDIFMKESVASIIEVKSTLDKKGLEQCISATKEVKGLSDNFLYESSIGYKPSLKSFLIAYNCDRTLETVYKWLIEINKTQEINIEGNLPKSGKERINVVNNSVDGIYILGKGFIFFENQPTSIVPNSYYEDRPDIQWVIVNQSKGCLLSLFVFLTNCISGFLNAPIALAKYLKHVRIANLKYGNGNTSQIKPMTLSNLPKISENEIIVDFSNAFAMWNEEILEDEKSIKIDVSRLKNKPAGFFIGKMPMYVKSNIEFNFLLEKLKKEKEIIVLPFYHENVSTIKWKLTLEISKSPFPGINPKEIINTNIYESIIILK